MKKIITMALVLVMVFGLAAPALAYTGNTPPAQGVSPYTVDIYLVEYLSSDILSGWITAPPTDRGYAKNEVIAAVGLLNVPANYNVYADAYRAVRFMPANVTLDVVDNIRSFSAAGAADNNYYSPVTNTLTVVGGVAGTLASRAHFRLHHTVPDYLSTSWDGTSLATLYWERDGDSGNLAHAITPNTSALPGKIPVNTAAKTYRFLVFGKVTGDNAKLTFSLTRRAGFEARVAPAGWAWNNSVNVPGGILPELASGTANVPINTALPMGAPLVTGLLVLNEDILVGRVMPDTIGANRYYVMENDENLGIAFNVNNTVGAAHTPGEVALIIDTGTRGKTTALYIYPSGGGGKGYAVVNESNLEDVVFVEITSSGVWSPIRSGNKSYAALRTFLDSWFDQLGFSVANIGNLLNQADWTALAAAAWDVTETVDIEPWTPYVSVPDNIVTDPPKTGDLSVMGFVMIALAAAAAVVVRKVRA